MQQIKAHKIGLFLQPSVKLLRLGKEAMRDFDMIQPGDRVLLALSGGKDSLTLLHLLGHLQCYEKTPFALGAITINPMIEGLNQLPLIDYLKALNVPYFFRSEPIMERAQGHMKNDSFCAWCSRMKRGLIYDTARKEGYNIIAMGQHLDDLAQSFLLSAFYGGTLKTMKAHYTNDAGDLRIIRPLVYVRERMTADFARSQQLPVIADNCPACFRMPSQRQHMKDWLLQEEKNNKGLFKSLLSTMRPLMTNASTLNMETDTSA